MANTPPAELWTRQRSHIMLLAGVLTASIALAAAQSLFKQQARETDRKKREAMLTQIQQTIYDRARFGPLYEFVWPSGIGPRVAESGLMLIDPYPWSAPLEEVRLKRP